MLGSALRTSRHFQTNTDAPIGQDVKLNEDLLAKLVTNQMTPPSKVIQKLEIQAADKADKQQKTKGLAPSVPATVIVSDEEEAVGVVAQVASTAPNLPESKEPINNYQKDHNFKTAASFASASLITRSLIDQKNTMPFVERLFRLKVFLHCIPAAGGTADFSSIQVSVPNNFTIEQVIKHTLQQYNEEKRKPPLVETHSLFELRTCSYDDEDEDDFVLDRRSEIGKVDFKVFSLAKASGVSNDQIFGGAGDAAYYPTIGKSASRSIAAASVETALFRVLMESQSYVVQVPKDNTLDKLLFAVAKKRKEVMNTVSFEFLVEEKVLEWDTLISDVKSENVELRRKAASNTVVKVITASSSSTPLPSDFFFTKESASIYKEYEVIKHKHRMKQRRIMGVDATRIYNMPSTSDGHESIGFSLRLSSLGAGAVKRKFRDMSDVVKAEMIADHPRMFHILFRDLETNAIVPYAYEAASEYECAEIVAKIEFLRR